MSPFLSILSRDEQNLSYERVLKTLVGLGLTRVEAEVYIHLATNGPTKAKNIAYALGMSRPAMDAMTKKLQTKGLVNAFLEKRSQLSAIPFEEALVILLKQRLSEAQTIELDRPSLLCKWEKMLKETHNGTARISDRKEENLS